MPYTVAQVFDIEGMPDYAQIFAQASADIMLTKQMCRSEDEIIEKARDADAVIAAATVQPITRRVLESLIRCRFIQSLGIGFEGVDVAAATEMGIMIANVPDYCLEEVSDHTMALILACTRKIVTLNEATRSGKWTDVAAPYIRKNIWPQMSHLRGQTLGLVGFGRIPRILVPKAKGFGLRIIAFDPYVPQGVFDALEVCKSGLDDLLMKSDIVSIHAPLTAETDQLMRADQFMKMKRTAYLVNTSRGRLVNTRELYACLIRNVIAGAALDVTEPEPLSADDPILKLDNVIVTAHSGGASPAAMAELWNRPGEEVLNVLVNEQWPRGLVNPQVKEKYQQKWKKH